METIEIATVDGPRTCPVRYRKGTWAVVQIQERAPGRRAHYSVTHVPSGMRLIETRTLRGAERAAREAHARMPLALDRLTHGDDARTLLAPATLRACAEVKRAIKAECA